MFWFRVVVVKINFQILKYVKYFDIYIINIKNRKREKNYFCFGFCVN